MCSYFTGSCGLIPCAADWTGHVVTLALAGSKDMREVRYPLGFVLCTLQVANCGGGRLRRRVVVTKVFISSHKYSTHGGAMKVMFIGNALARD